MSKVHFRPETDTQLLSSLTPSLHKANETEE